MKNPIPHRALIAFVFLALNFSIFTPLLFSQITAVAIPVNSPVVNHSFEVPNYPNDTFVYRPTGPTVAWQYNGSSGLSTNNTGFTSNLAAPDGNQIAFLQGKGFIVGRVTVPASGFYRLSLKAAQRPSAGISFNQFPQTIGIELDGNDIGTFTPSAANYESYSSIPLFFAASGTYVLKIAGLNPYGGDNTAFIDDLLLEQIPQWSVPSTWSTNTVPGPTDSVSIPMGKSVVLDVSGDVDELLVMGTLQVRYDQNLDFAAQWVLIMGPSGHFEWGQPEFPYPQNGLITLKGLDQDTIAGMGTKFLVAMMGGRLDLHGNPRSSWTQLDATADSNATSITLADSMGWLPGDSIIIASSDFNFEYDEKVGITSVSTDGKTFGISPGLQYKHFGDSLLYTNSYRTFFMDERCEVGLLSRNLKVQGDAQSDPLKFGGHIMIMTGSEGYCSGVELFRMGQAGKLGRYPWHYHLTGDLSGQFVKNSSIHHSFNRVLTVHSSTNVLIEDNVAYEHIGNGYFLENGDELHNQFIHNLGLGTLLPGPGEVVRPFDSVVGGGYVKLPATFWITNPNNDFVGNSAAGSEGSGFWFVNLPYPIENGIPTGIIPRQEPLGLFDNNRAHSNSFSNLSFDAAVDTNTFELIDFFGYQPKDSMGNFYTPWINRLTGYKCRSRNVWMRTNTLGFRDAAFADNHWTTFFSFNNLLQNSLIVGKSPNTGNLETSFEITAGYDLPLDDRTHEASSNTFRGLSLYDGPFEVDSIHFDGFNGNAFCVLPNGAAVKTPQQFVRNVSFGPDVLDSNKVNFFSQSSISSAYSSGMIDEDGTFFGDPGRAGHRLAVRPLPPDAYSGRIYDSLFCVEPNAEFVKKWNAFITDEKRYALLRCENKTNGALTGTPIYHVRSDGQAVFDEMHQFVNGQIPVIVNDTFRYWVQYHKFHRSQKFHTWFGQNGDITEIVIANVPSEGIINAPNFAVATTFQQYESSSAEMYYFDNNTLHVRLVGANDGVNMPYGDSLQAKSSSFTLCHPSGCSGSGITTEVVTLADYEMGLDERAFVRTNGDLILNPITFNGSAAPGGADDRNGFSLTSDGDGVDEWVEYVLPLGPRQVWTDFSHLHIDFEGTDMEVVLEDLSEGDISLGTFKQGNYDEIPLGWIPTSSKDEIVAIKLRIQESTLGSTSIVGLDGVVDILDLSIEVNQRHWGFAENNENWVPGNKAATHNLTPGQLHVDILNGIPVLISRFYLGFLDPENDKFLKVRLNNFTGSNFIYLQWFKDGLPQVQTAGVAIDPNPGWQEVVMDLSTNPNWAGDITVLAFYPTIANTGSMDLDYLEFTDCPACPTCYDGIKNGDETDIDCGGSCPQDCPIAGVKFEFGNAFNIPDESWTPIPTQHTYDSAVVIATPILQNNGQKPVVTRVRNVTETGFELQVQNPGGTTNDDHTVHYFVVEQGVYTQANDNIDMEAFRVSSQKTAGWQRWIFEPRSVVNTYSNPVVLGQVMTENDLDWSVFWASQIGSRAVPPTPLSIAAGKEIAEDLDSTRADETLGIIVIESGAYTLQGKNLSAGVGGDKIVGVDDLVPISFPSGVSSSSYNIPSLTNLEKVVLSSAGMDGVNGGWPVIFGGFPLSGNNINLRIDEDQIGDSERNHTTEQVAYLALGNNTILKPENEANLIEDEHTLATENRVTEEDIPYTLQLSPNPVAKGSILTLSVSDAKNPLKASLLTLQGKEIIQWYFEGGQSTYSLPLQGVEISAGVYLVKIVQGEQTTLKRLVIMGSNF